MMLNNQKSTINELLGKTKKEKITYESFIVRKCFELCDKPIADFEIEDYRMLVSQEIGLQYIMANVIEILSQNIFAEGDFYEGDLLKSVLSIKNTFWNQNLDLKKRLQSLCVEKFSEIDKIDLSIEVKDKLKSAVNSFLSV